MNKNKSALDTMFALAKAEVINSALTALGIRAVKEAPGVASNRGKASDYIRNALETLSWPSDQSIPIAYRKPAGRPRPITLSKNGAALPDVRPV